MLLRFLAVHDSWLQDCEGRRWDTVGCFHTSHRRAMTSYDLNKCFKQCREQPYSQQANCEEQCLQQYKQSGVVTGDLSSLSAQHGLKDYKINAEDTQLKRDLNGLNHSHGRSSDAIRAGRAAEEFHQRSFNADAIKKDIPHPLLRTCPIIHLLTSVWVTKMCS